MITPHDKIALLNLIGYDRSIPELYEFLYHSLEKEAGYKNSDKKLSQRLIKYLDSLNENQRVELIREARALAESSNF